MERSVEGHREGAGTTRGPSSLRRRLRRACIAAVLTASLSGCYSYNRVELETLPPATDVRLHLTWESLEGRDDLAAARIVSPDERPVVSGTLLERDPTSVMLRVPVRNPSLGTGYPGTPIEQRVSIPIEAIWDTEARSLRRLETGLLVAGSVVAVGLFINHIVGNAITEGSAPPPLDDDDENRVPRGWGSIRLPW